MKKIIIFDQIHQIRGSNKNTGLFKKSIQIRKIQIRKNKYVFDPIPVYRYTYIYMVIGKKTMCVVINCISLAVWKLLYSSII